MRSSLALPALAQRKRGSAAHRWRRRCDQPDRRSFTSSPAREGSRLDRRGGRRPARPAGVRRGRRRVDQPLLDDPQLGLARLRGRLPRLPDRPDAVRRARVDVHPARCLPARGGPLLSRARRLRGRRRAQRPAAGEPRLARHAVDVRRDHPGQHLPGCARGLRGREDLLRRDQSAALPVPVRHRSRQLLAPARRAERPSRLDRAHRRRRSHARCGSHLLLLGEGPPPLAPGQAGRDDPLHAATLRRPGRAPEPRGLRGQAQLRSA